MSIPSHAALHLPTVPEDASPSPEDVARARAELDQLTYAISHDLKEPLRIVTSFVDLLARRYGSQLDEEGREMIAFAVDGARRMQELLDALLLFSRAGTRLVEPETMDLEDVLQSVEKRIHAAVRESAATITHSPLPIVVADRSQVAEVLVNLVGNAIKFRGEAPPRIDVAARKEAGGVVVTVEDHGIGIAPRHFERVFGVFERLHPRGRYPGTGIGLALCKRIVERHGGRIWVESEGARTAFSFFLPQPAVAGPLTRSRHEQARVA